MHPALRDEERQHDLRPPIKGRIAEEFHVLKSWLPQKADDILDIGCGYPYIDVWLARHYGGDVTIHLMDGDERIPPVGKEQVGFQTKTVPWKSRHVAVQYLQQEVPDCKIQSHPPDPGLTIPCDLIISRRAWGHHFSIQTYLELAVRSLRPKGRIIVDIRGGTTGIQILEAVGFRVLCDALECRSIKCQRFVLSR